MQNISIFGYGVTAKPLVEFLNAQNQKLKIYDDKFSSISQDEYGNTLLPSSEFVAKNSDLEILSPGFAPYHKLVRESKNLTCEYDYFYNLLDSKPFSVWISGTNGKTTTTQMTELLLKSRGATSGGNIGVPLAKLYNQNFKIWILETSSFSLHYIKSAAPEIYALLPVREDHITWHGSFEAYIDDKLRILELMESKSSAIIPQELSNHKSVKNFKGTIYFYADSASLAKKLDIDSSKIIFKEPFLLDALIALSIEKIGFQTCSIELLNSFKIGAHRIEEFFDKQNRLWVNDSKGTNVDATIEAIRRYQDRQILLILGGDDKGANLEPLFTFMQDKNISIIAIGSNEGRLQDMAKKYNISFIGKGNLQEAMKHIKSIRKSDDVVLLSPAAASLDQFSSYAKRGEEFVRLALDS